MTSSSQVDVPVRQQFSGWILMFIFNLNVWRQGWDSHWLGWRIRFDPKTPQRNSVDSFADRYRGPRKQKSWFHELDNMFSSEKKNKKTYVSGCHLLLGVVPNIEITAYICLWSSQNLPTKIPCWRWVSSSIPIASAWQPCQVQEAAPCAVPTGRWKNDWRRCWRWGVTNPRKIGAELWGFLSQGWSPNHRESK